MRKNTNGNGIALDESNLDWKNNTSGTMDGLYLGWCSYCHPLWWIFTQRRSFPRCCYCPSLPLLFIRIFYICRRDLFVFPVLNDECFSL